jgi:hypothetical protein
LNRYVVILSLLLICFLPSIAAAQANSDSRQIQDSGDIQKTPQERMRLAQKRCMLHFYGPDSQTGVGGKGTYIFGLLIPLEHGYGSKRAIFAPSLSLNLGVRIRRTENACTVITQTGENPPPNLVLEASDDARWLKYWSISVGLQTFSFSQLPSFQVTSGSFAFAVFAGHDWTRVWWSNPDDIASKHTLTFGLAVIAGIGQASLSADKSLASAVLLGPGVTFDYAF